MNKRLERSNDKWIAGVCSGLAEYFNLDTNLLRILYLLLTLFSAAFPGIIIYLFLWILMPKSNKI